MGLHIVEVDSSAGRHVDEGLCFQYRPLVREDVEDVQQKSAAGMRRDDDGQRPAFGLLPVNAEFAGQGLARLAATQGVVGGGEDIFLQRFALVIDAVVEAVAERVSGLTLTL